MARLVEGTTEHWLTPSRQAESELASTTIEALVPDYGDRRGHRDPGGDQRGVALRT